MKLRVLINARGERACNIFILHVSIIRLYVRYKYNIQLFRRFRLGDRGLTYNNEKERKKKKKEIKVAL